jgi:outer membrane protein assembly factor BamA
LKPGVRCVLLLLLVFAVISPVPAPAAGGAGEGGKSDPRLRKEILERRRRAKLDSLDAPQKPAIEKIVEYLETGEVVNKLRYGYYGFFPLFGGMSTNAEIAFGVFYLNDGLLKNYQLTCSASLSANRYQQYDASLLATRLGGLPLSLELYNRYRNFPEEEHFGLGPDSFLEDGGVYRLEDYTATAKLMFDSIRWVEVTGRTGYLRSRTASGIEGDDPSVEFVLPATDLPGFKESIEYWLSEVTATMDSRDSRWNPRSGILLTGVHTIYKDQDGGGFDFRYSNAELQHYIPFFHKHRVLALRARVADAKPRSEGIVPFHFLPHVGGANSIRGFEEYRFRDGKLMLANVEYRFEAFIGLDVALFGDFGQVASRWKNIRTSDFESSYGAGLRFNTVHNVFLRLDLGHGREGTKFFLKFSNVF